MRVLRDIFASRPFRPIEKALLCSIRSALPTQAQPVFDAQLNAIRKVQRISGSPEICFYARSRWKDVPLFKRSDEFPLALMSFSVRGKRYRATLYCVQGHIFALVIRPNHAQIGFKMSDSAHDIKVLNDPMNASDSAPSSTRIAQRWWRFLNEHGDRGRTAGWELYDETSAYLVSLANGEFLVLAERNGDQFILQEIEADSDSDRKLFYVPAHESGPEIITQSLEHIVFG